MNTPEFNAVFEQTVEMCRQTLCAKADEYAEDDDRLHNFNTAAVLQGTDPTPKESQEINVMMQDFTDWVKDGRQYVSDYGRQRCWQRRSIQSSLSDKGNFVDYDELPM